MQNRKRPMKINCGGNFIKIDFYEKLKKLILLKNKKKRITFDRTFK